MDYSSSLLLYVSLTAFTILLPPPNLKPPYLLSLPSLSLGDADFVMSIENRVCQERQYVQRVTSLDWDTVEPNTGIMHIRSNRYSLTMFQLWLQGM